METKTLIPVNNGFGHRAKNLIRFVDTSHLPQTATMPPLHSIVSRMNGKVTLTEYDSHEEYTHHRNQVFDAIARFHDLHGVVPGCECRTCKER